MEALLDIAANAAIGLMAAGIWAIICVIRNAWRKRK